MNVTILSILQRLFNENKVPSALLIKGNLREARLIVKSFVQWACCATHENCGTCSSCLWLQGGHHPDVMQIMPHEKGHAIKIEDVRELIHWAYQSSTVGHRWGIIDDAGCLNRHSANALLKILEEPSLSTHFILIVDHEYLLPNTILSRCVRFELPNHHVNTESQEKLKAEEYRFISMLQSYLSDQVELIKLLQFLEEYALDDVLWFLQQICSDVILQRLLKRVSPDHLAVSFSVSLASWWTLWDALLTSREQIRLGVHFHESLLLTRLFLLLKSPCCSSNDVLL